VSKKRRRKKEVNLYLPFGGLAKGKKTEGRFPSSVTFCSHWRDPVKVGNYTVYASEKRYSAKNEDYTKEPTPQLGIYLTHSWASTFAYFIGCGITPPKEEGVLWPFVAADWPDMGVLPANEQSALLDFTIKNIKAGKRVEIACMGGHGRTGTLLAMLRVLLGKMEPKEAIESLRADYCNKVVEGSKQIEAVYKLAGVPFKEDTAPKPAKSYPITSFSPYNTPYNTLCESCNHSKYSHQRAESEYNQVGCAFGTWKRNNEKSVKLDCDCKKFKREDKKDVDMGDHWSSVDGWSSTGEQLLDRKKESNEELEWLDSITPETLELWPDDLCKCKCPRKKHTAAKEGCTGCTCKRFLCDILVTNPEGGVVEKNKETQQNTGKKNKPS